MSTYTKTTWIDGSAPAINANNLNKIENQLEQNTNDISITNHVLDLFNDTSGSTWQDMMKNKLDYCVANINTTKTNIETFINGGWSGANFGFGIFSKIGTVYQLVWYSSNATYYCRKMGNGTYQYTDMSITDTGWRDFSWRNSTYTTGNTYTQNKWRVKNGVLYIQVGAGSSSAINTAEEIEIARIPITGNTSFNSHTTRIWNGAVGSGGSVAGFIVMQNPNYISVYLKPHLNSSFYAGSWYSTHFAIPLDSTSSIL